jgi:hypothetical protein
VDLFERGDALDSIRSRFLALDSAADDVNMELNNFFLWFLVSTLWVYSFLLTRFHDMGCNIFSLRTLMDVANPAVETDNVKAMVDLRAGVKNARRLNIILRIANNIYKLYKSRADTQVWLGRFREKNNNTFTIGNTFI